MQDPRDETTADLEEWPYDVPDQADLEEPPDQVEDDQPIPGITPLPAFPQATEPETLATFGLRVLRFVIAYECTATLSLEDLETADHFYPIAVRNLDPDRYSPTMIDRLADARRTIQAAIRWRQAETKERLAVLVQSPQDGRSPTPGSDRTDDDKGARLKRPTPHNPNTPAAAVDDDPYHAARERIAYLNQLRGKSTDELEISNNAQRRKEIVF